MNDAYRLCIFGEREKRSICIWEKLVYLYQQKQVVNDLMRKRGAFSATRYDSERLCMNNPHTVTTFE